MMHHRTIKQILGTAWLALASMLSFLPGTALAGDPQADLTPSLRERELLNLIGQGKFIKARAAAEELLKDDPASIFGQYALARVFEEGEGDLVRAQALFKKTIGQFERQYLDDGKAPKSQSLRAWHLQFLSEYAQLFAELDQRENQLNVYERIRVLYDQPYGVQAVWPLLKLDRFEEAQAIDRSAINGEDKFAKSVAYNNEMAIEDARHRYMDSSIAGKKAVEYTASEDCVVLTNQARAVFYFLNSDDAIAYTLKADKAPDQTCPEPPLLESLEPYILKAQFQKAISAMKKVRKEPISKKMRIQAEMNIRMGMVSLFLTLGMPDKARTLAKTIVEAPGRLGYNSLSYDQYMLALRVMYFATLNSDLVRQQNELDLFRAEKSTWMFDKEQREKVVELVKKIDELKRTRWEVTQKAIRAFLELKNIRGLVVPYYVLPIHFMDTLVDIVGEGTVNSVIRIEKGEITEEEARLFEPVWHYIRGYARWRSGAYSEAINALNESKKSLDGQQQLLIYMCDAILGASYKELGETDSAWNAWRGVMREYPSAFMRAGIRIPVKRSPDVDPHLSKAVDEVLKLDRTFEVRDDAPYSISAYFDGDWPVFCLLEQGGQRLVCSSQTSQDYGIENDAVPENWQVMNQFVQSIYTPRVDLSQSDIHSLDGSPLRASARDALNELVF